jgi:hypothetical protein
MQNYKLSVSKNWKKYTIVFKADSEKHAREKVHEEWYSILSIETINQKEEIWSTFIFKVRTQTWEEKKWKLVWNDLFKAYVKLKKDLDYDVLEIFPEEEEKNLNENQKLIIVNDLKEEYDLVFAKVKEKKVKLEELDDVPKEKKLDNFYLKKELSETYKLIDFILEKLGKLLSWETWIELELEQKEKLKNIFNSIIKLKKSTNIAKLKIIWEVALIKIWKIELDYIENKHEEWSKELLKETNLLLRKIWSKESFIEKNKDIKYLFKIFSEKISSYFSFFNKKKKEEIDKHSHSYVKNILFLKRYKEKYKENTIFIIKNIFSILFSSELRSDTFIRRKVLKQNIYLLKAKEKGTSFSYTYIKRWFNGTVKLLFWFINSVKKYLFTVILTYILLFLLLLNINYYYDLYSSNYEWIFYFIITFLIYLVLYIYRNLFYIILNFVILFFIVIFWVVNF